MTNGILRDVVFACAGVVMVIAAIGLPRQAQAGSPQWQMQFQGTTHLLPFYSNPPRVHGQVPGSGPGGPSSQIP
jgi:hypothetical protein